MSDEQEPVRIGVLTSGGDAQGMNAAVRAVVRTARHHGAVPYAIHEGWQGAVQGGDGIRELGWDDVGNILQRGGTMIGTARSADFRERWGMRAAARNLLEHGIDRLVVIGGDGSLTGTNEFRKAWPGLLAELVEAGEISPELAAAHPALMIAGLVGSIDNDLVGTDSTIGADSALHRIVEAIDALSSTAAAHQRAFVVEVMGRHCGYLPLMAALAGGCDYVLVPEQPPGPGWEDELCRTLQQGRQAGRRDSLVIVAEGARDRDGTPIKAGDVQRIIHDRIGEDARVTILGHVQRGGTPSAFDRWMSTVLGYQAVRTVLEAKPEDDATILGLRGNRVAHLDLVEAVEATRAVPALIESGDEAALAQARGASFTSMSRIFRLLSDPPTEDAVRTGYRIAVLHAGGLAPGMNPAARAAVRLGSAAGHTMLGVTGSWAGLIGGAVRELTWGDVDAWIGEGGAELGTSRAIPTLEELYAISRALERHEIGALLVIGGLNGYLAAAKLVAERERYPAFRIPIVCVPASLDNNLPGSELSIGADTAVNDAVAALDRIKQSASAVRRCFVAEVMGRRCGYVTLITGLAVGAERVYLAEHGITLAQVQDDVARVTASFAAGRRFFLALRNEQASEAYTTDVLAKLFEAEGGPLYDVRQHVLGHVQQGGDPSPFDRILATRLVGYAIDGLTEQLVTGRGDGVYVGIVEGRLTSSPLARMGEEIDAANGRPREQWWLSLQPVLDAVSAPNLAASERSVPDAVPTQTR